MKIAIYFMKYIISEFFFKGSIKEVRCAIGSKYTTVFLCHVCDPLKSSHSLDFC